MDDLHTRLAADSDVDALEALVARSVRELVGRSYDARQIDSSLRYLFGVDRQLIDDGTYYVVEQEGAIVGCGGWSRRWTPYGGSQEATVRDAGLRDPAVDPAVIRAFFVEPAVARRGIGRVLLDACEAAARSEGYRHFELVATLSGQPFYARHGYADAEPVDHRLPDGVTLRFVRMTKRPGD